MVANLVGFVIGPSGISWLKSVFLQAEGLPTLFGLLVTFYVGTKLMFHISDSKQRTHQRWAPKFSDNQDVSSDSDVSSGDVNDDALFENGKEDSHSEADIIPKTVFEEGEVKSSDIKEKSNEVQQEAQSEDPFKIYDLLKTKHPVSNVARQYEGEPMYPPGFTPCDNSANIDSSFCGAKIHQKESSEKENGSKTCFKEDVNASVCSGHFKKKGDVIVMGDFNEVRFAEERFRTIFNARGATVFNSFITSGGLVEVPTCGYSFTWSHKSAAKMNKGEATSTMLDERLNIMNDLTSLENNVSLELAQKAKNKWAIECDENSKFFHGIINKHRNNLAVRGIIADGEWIEEPNAVKNDFFSHFRDRFDRPCKSRLTLDMKFPNKLSTYQSHYLERPFSMEEVKGAVWGCGLNKSPGPDGFTFEFYRRY
nr:RNA-directed DNA polymerase, eukaryota [Tanacetum cinerariifolium]